MAGQEPWWKNRKKTKIYKAEGGRAGYRGGGRTNLLEELGRVEGEHSNKNRRAEVSRIHGELNKGYKKGGRIGLKEGTGGQEPWWKNRKKTKIYKASGGRIGLKHGSSAQSHYLQHGYGPTKTKLKSGKPKIAIKGWS